MISTKHQGSSGLVGPLRGIQDLGLGISTMVTLTSPLPTSPCQHRIRTPCFLWPTRHHIGVGPGELRWSCKASGASLRFRSSEIRLSGFRAQAFQGLGLGFGGLILKVLGLEFRVRGCRV